MAQHLENNVYQIKIDFSTNVDVYVFPTINKFVKIMCYTFKYMVIILILLFDTKCRKTYENSSRDLD